MKLNIKRTVDKDFSPDKILAFLLKDRGITADNEFLNPPHPRTIDFKEFFPKSFNFDKKLEKVINLFKKIREEGRTIVVYTDYDADGITGGAILWETLHLLGFKVMPYVPDRKTEGYGFSIKGIDSVKEKFNPALIISVDHGIVGNVQISYAVSMGIPVIVTDHHQKGDSEPEAAFAIFHTDKLSGSGVSYFFSKKIFDSLPSPTTNHQLLTTNFSGDYLALASVGTIADLVPIIGASRSIVKFGLESFAKTRRHGILHLLKQAQIADKEISPYEIGFIIAPRINAFGRLEHAIDALRLLCTVSEGRAQELAAKAGVTNKTRQGLVEVGVAEALDMVSNKEKIIILYSDNWEEGILGLIASKMVEKFYKPTIVMTKSDGYAKASVRSVLGVDITKFLRGLKDYLINVGGHAAAAGFSIAEDQIESFTKAALKKAEEEIDDKVLVRSMNVDLELPLTRATVELCNSLQAMQPFGIGNPQPVFYSRAEIVGAKLLGSTGKHLKMYLKQQDSYPVEFVYFNKGELFTQLSPGQNIDAVYTLDIDRWGGKERVVAKGKYIEINGD